MKPFLHLRLAGGLGNQLFQFGMASLLATRHGGGVTICDATSRYAAARARALSDVIREDWPAPPSWVRWCHQARLGRLALPGSINDSNAREILQVEPRRLSGPKLLDGYFQDCWSNESIGALVAEVRRYAATPPHAKHVAVHIRGGDFLKLPAYNIVGAPFYRTALRTLKSRLGTERLAATIVTDDQAYARAMLSECNLGPDFIFSFANTGSASEDFQLLRSARARVFANSTFAWWATALGAPEAPTVCFNRWTQQTARGYFLPNETAVT